MNSEKKILTAGDIIDAIRKVETSDERQRLVEVLDLLQLAESDADAGVALDFMSEVQFLPQQTTNRLRGVDSPTEINHSFYNPIDETRLIWIPPGTCYLGRESRRAECPGFFLSEHPITNEQFKYFLDSTGYEPAADHLENEKFLSHWGRGKPAKKILDHPVTWVSMIDAQAYCHWASTQLPLESHWEKAARGEDGRDFPWDEGWKIPAHVDKSGTCSVTKYENVRTTYGCQQMIGNVSEWCFPSSQHNESIDPNSAGGVYEYEDGQYGIVRGSCFLRIDKSRMKSWYRRRLSFQRRNQWVGFRPAFYPVGFSSRKRENVAVEI